MAATSTVRSARRRWRAGRRGLESVDALVDEATALAERHPEIVLTGIHIGHYGVDTDDSLSSLVERLVRDVPRVRFRLSSLEATEVDDRLRELFAAAGSPRTASPRAVAVGVRRGAQANGSPLVHVRQRTPLPSSELPRAVPVFALGADVIAGFPGETEDDHRATLCARRVAPVHVSARVSVSRCDRARRRSASPATSRATTIDRRSAELRVDRRASRRGASRVARVGAECDLVVMGTGARREGLTEDYLTVGVDVVDPARNAMSRTTRG